MLLGRNGRFSKSESATNAVSVSCYLHKVSPAEYSSNSTKYIQTFQRLALEAQASWLMALLLLSWPLHPWLVSSKIPFCMRFSTSPYMVISFLHGGNPWIWIIIKKMINAIIESYNFQVSKLGLKPLARIVGYGDAAVEPVDWPVAPALGVQQMLDRCERRFMHKKTIFIEKS